MQSRLAAYEADKQEKMPVGLELQLGELGLSYLSIAEEHGGAATHYGIVTGALIAEDLAHGDMSIAYGLLSPLSVASAISRWGDAGQQETYLESFVEEQPPKAAIAVQSAVPYLTHSNYRRRQRQAARDTPLMARSPWCHSVVQNCIWLQPN